MARCPWCGLPCECTEFPYLRDGIVPSPCEAKMPDAMLGVRKVSTTGKVRYQAYLDSLKK